ncbi:SoxR reducing system RseC family protein, partial [bacterium]|nr:SoxR reducing system RseC family protein [bacterium]
MERIDYGVVSFIGNKFIKTNIYEDSNECISCPLNGKCKSNIEITFKVKTPKNYEVGERIKIKVYTSKRLWYQFLLMGLPILLLIMGVILGGIIFHTENGSA